MFGLASYLSLHSRLNSAQDDLSAAAFQGNEVSR
jgi:hypothetical protein